jgi:hypothetical protein
MTAIAFYVDPHGGIFVASDGAIYESGTGLLQGFVSKVVMMPEIETVFAMRGNGGFFPALQSLIVARYTDFDGLVADIEDLTRKAFDAYVDAYDAHEASITIALGGFSRSSGQYAAYRLSSSERQIIRGENTEVLPAWQPDLVDGIWVAPISPTSIQVQFGLYPAPSVETDQQLLNYLARMVCAARQSTTTPTDADPDPVLHTVGGFLQITILRQESCFTAITHRWPDVVGEPIDPNRGDAMPPYLIDDA